MPKRIKLPEDDIVKRSKRGLGRLGRRAEAIERELTREEPKRGVDAEMLTEFALRGTELATAVHHEYSVSKAGKALDAATTKLREFDTELNLKDSDTILESLETGEYEKLEEGLVSSLDENLAPALRERTLERFKRLMTKTRTQTLIRATNKNRQEFKAQLKLESGELSNRLTNDPGLNLDVETGNILGRAADRFGKDSKEVTRIEEFLTKEQFRARVGGYVADSNWDKAKSELSKPESDRYFSAFEKQKYLDAITKQRSKPVQYTNLKYRLDNFDKLGDLSGLTIAAAELPGNVKSAVLDVQAIISGATREGKLINQGQKDIIFNQLDLYDHQQAKLKVSIDNMLNKLNLNVKKDPIGTVEAATGQEDTRDATQKEQTYNRVLSNKQTLLEIGKLKSALLQGPKAIEAAEADLRAKYGKRGAELAMVEVRELMKQTDKSGSRQQKDTGHIIYSATGPYSVPGANAAALAVREGVDIPSNIRHKNFMSKEWVEKIHSIPYGHRESVQRVIQLKAAWKAREETKRVVKGTWGQVTSDEEAEIQRKEYTDALEEGIEEYFKNTVTERRVFRNFYRLNVLGPGGEPLTFDKREVILHPQGQQKLNEFTHGVTQENLANMTDTFDPLTINALKRDDIDIEFVPDNFGFSVYLTDDRGLKTKMRLKNRNDVYIQRSDIFTKGMGIFDELKEAGSK